MSIFIVTWAIVSFVPGPCPDYKPDKYGRWPTTQCLVYHGQQVKEEKQAEFKTLKEAKDFIDGAKDSLCGKTHSFTCLSDFKIEENKQVEVKYGNHQSNTRK